MKHYSKLDLKKIILMISLSLCLTAAYTKSVLSEVQVFIPEQEKTVSPGASTEWWNWLHKEGERKFLCQDNFSITIRSKKINEQENEPRLISFQYFSEAGAIDLFIQNIFGRKHHLGLSNNPSSDGDYALFYEPIRINVFNSKSWGRMTFSKTSGNYSLFFNSHRKGIYHIKGDCEYLS